MRRSLLTPRTGLALSLPLLLAACGRSVAPEQGAPADASLTPLAVPVGGQTYAILTSCKNSTEYRERGLDVADASTVDGGSVTLWEYLSRTNQQWTLQPVANSSNYKIVAKHSGKVLDVYRNGQVDGTPVTQYQNVANASNQQWQLEDAGDGTYEIIPQNATGLRLDLFRSETANGTKIQIYTDNNGCNQRWILKATTPTYTGKKVTDPDIGAIPNDTGDDTAALQEAANRTSSNQSLVFPAGIYNISRPILFNNPNGVTISGSGAIIRVIPNSGMPTGTSGNHAHIFVFKSPINTTVTQLTFVGVTPANPLSTSEWQDAIEVFDGSYVTIDGVVASKVSGDGIHFRNSNNTVVKNNTIYNVSAHNIEGTDSITSTISNNMVIGLLNSVSSLNEEFTPRGIGILGSGGRDWLIESNTIRRIANTATKTEASNDVIYRNNIIDGFRRDAIKIMALTERYDVPNVYNGTIEGNRVSGYSGELGKFGGEGPPSACFKLASVMGGKVINNTCNGRWGSLSGPPPTGVQENGINLEEYFNPGKSSDARPDFPNNILVEGNKIDNTVVGIRVETNNSTFRSNTSTNNRSYNIIVENEAKNNLITLNTLVTSGWSSINTLTNTVNNTFSNNIIRGPDSGIYSESSGNKGLKIIDNNFTSTTRPVRVINLPKADYTCLGNMQDGTTGSIPYACP